MMRCLLIDDEPLALNLIEDNLKSVNYIQVAGRCQNAGDALLLLQSEKIDLLFCDIGMPGLNGLQLVKSLIQKPMVIFVTAYEKFAIEGFELDVIDYLVKPVPIERFLKACAKAFHLFELNKIQTEATPVTRDHIFVASNYALIKIRFDEIEYIEGLKDYVKINIAGQPRPVISRTTIKGLELQLPTHMFYRIHKSYIVNVNHVAQIRRGKIKMNTVELSLSDNYRDMINRMIGNRID